MALDLEKIADQLSTLFVAVGEKDATDYKKLQMKLLSCNANQDTVVTHLTRIEPLIAKQENSIANKKFELSTRKQDIKTNVENVKKLPTGKERDEAAEEMLHTDYKELLAMDNYLNTLKMVRSALTATLRKLKTTEQNIKLLKSMLDEQVNKLSVGSDGDPDVAHLQKSLSELDNLDDQLEDEIGLDDDVEDSEEYTEEHYSDDVSHDESEQPSNEPLDSQDSHDDAEELLMDLDDLTESGSDESDEPSNEPLDSEESREEEVESEESSDEDSIELLIGGDDDFDPLEEDSSENSTQEDEGVTDKQPAPSSIEEEANSKRKRTPMEEILGEDLPDGEPMTRPIESAVVEDSDIDISSFMDDDIDLVGEENSTEDSSSGDSQEEVKVEDSRPEEEKESKVVEDDASIGEEYDIESLLDM